MSAILSYCNLLEAPAFADLFALYPPEGFSCRRDPSGLPLFLAQFDLLTTLDSRLRGRLAALPLFRFWSALLRFPTCFAGTTITEYAPWPRDVAPETILDSLLREHGLTKSLIIIKDLPASSPLLPEEDNILASRLAALAENKGFIAVEGQALAYVRLDFPDMDGYLARLSARRRKNLRRKLKKRARLEVEIVPLGEARFYAPAFLAELYAQYMAVYEQSEIHFDLLNRDFFTALLQSREIAGVVFLYRSGGALAGYNICLVHNGMLIDKYIGFAYPLARELNLYFISWMVNLEYALANGLRVYIAGWTDPEVKAGLGASFTFTRHLVRVSNPVLRGVLRPLRRFFEADGRILRSGP